MDILLHIHPLIYGLTLILAAIFAYAVTFAFLLVAKLFSKQRYTFFRAYFPMVLATFVTFIPAIYIDALSDRYAKIFHQQLSLTAILSFIFGIIAYSIVVKWLLKINYIKTFLISASFVFLDALGIQFIGMLLPP